MKAEILSEEELTDLTGYKQRSFQRQWLNKRNWVFVESRGGHPLVGRMYTRMKLGMAPPTLSAVPTSAPATPTWIPDFSRVS